MHPLREGFREEDDLPMAIERMAAKRVRAACDELDVNYELAIKELEADLKDIAQGVLSDRALRHVIKTLALMRGWQ